MLHDARDRQIRRWQQVEASSHRRSTSAAARRSLGSDRGAARARCARRRAGDQMRQVSGCHLVILAGCRERPDAGPGVTGLDRRASERRSTSSGAGRETRRVGIGVLGPAGIDGASLGGRDRKVLAVLVLDSHRHRRGNGHAPPGRPAGQELRRRAGARTTPRCAAPRPDARWARTVRTRPGTSKHPRRTAARTGRASRSAPARAG